MAFPEVWTFLARYKEFIINGLDLLSFILVTPKIVRTLLPNIEKYFTYAFIAILTICPTVAVIAVWNFLTARLPPHGDIPNWIFFLVIFSIVAFFTAIVLLGVKVLELAEEKIPDWLAANAFSVGVLMFLVSRITTFLLAAHQVLSE